MSATPPRLKWALKPVGADNEYILGKLAGLTSARHQAAGRTRVHLRRPTMLLTCPKCKTKNFLDPYPFWNFKGTTQCAGCRTIWRIETSGRRVCVRARGSQGSPWTCCPASPRSRTTRRISGPGLTRPAPRARKDAVCKPIPMEQNIRGNVISGHPLKKERPCRQHAQNSWLPELIEGTGGHNGQLQH